jgi:hypothetical protein
VGNANAKRFEPVVAGDLAAVVSGQKAAFDVAGSRRALGAADLAAYLAAPGGTDAPGNLTHIFQRLADLATSWGLTQIMGFHLLMAGVSSPAEFALHVSDPSYQLAFTLQMLAFCAEQNQIDLAMPDRVAASDFFTWWNCGRINGKTFDPAYVPNGLERMRIYSALAATPPAPAVVQ